MLKAGVSLKCCRSQGKNLMLLRGKAGAFARLLFSPCVAFS